MKRIVIALLFVLFLAVPKAHALLASSSDAWQYTKFSSYATSGALSDVRNMFGYNSGGGEGAYTLLADHQPLNAWHSVEWTLNSSLTLGSFNLVAAHDGDIRGRGFKEFILEYKSGLNFIELYHLVNADPNNDGQYGGGVNYTGLNELELYQIVAPTTAQTWRAWFKQAGGPGLFTNSQYASGPRIFELDGYAYVPSPVVPEPASMSLLGLGLLGLARKFRRK